MELSVISPTSKQEFSIAWIELETTVGNFVIQHGHAATVLLLTPNQSATICLNNGKQETIAIPGGIAYIKPAETLLLLLV